MRSVTLHVFASVKGGVGKSTLAVQCARLCAAAGRPTVLFDFDFTGTSLADGLPLRAPAVEGGEGVRIDRSTAPGDALLTLEEVRARRARRQRGRDEASGCYLPYVNDLITLFDPTTDHYPVEWFMWRHEPDDGVIYIPSSPFRVDVRVARGWLMYETPGAFPQHIAWLVDRVLRARPTVTDIVFDLPPGTIGIPHLLLSIASKIERQEPLPEFYPTWPGEISWCAFLRLVTTEDRNDLFAAVDYIAEEVARGHRLRGIVNRRVDAVERTREAVRALHPPGLGIESLLDFVDFDNEALGTIFRMAGEPSVSAPLRRQMERVFGIQEARP